MATPAWAALMRYVRRRLRERWHGDITDLVADVQVDLAHVVAADRPVRSWYRLADCLIAKHLDRVRRRQSHARLVADAADLHGAPPAAWPAFDLRPSHEARPPVEKMPQWRLLRGSLERSIVRGLWAGESFRAIAIRSRCDLKEVHRVAKELPQKIRKRRDSR